MDYTIGELATLSGLTVRALHHYEKLGLLPPPQRTEAGYRRFGEADVARLHRILAYQQMGLPLKEIVPLLGPDAPPLVELLRRQVAEAEARLAREQALVAMLRRVERRAADGAGDGALTDELLKLMSLMRTYERHLDAAELQRLLALQAGIGDDERRRLKAELAALVPALRTAHERGADPADADVAGLARRLLALGAAFPQDEALRGKMKRMVVQEPGMQRETGLTPALIAFIEAATDRVRGEAR